MLPFLREYREPARATAQPYTARQIFFKINVFCKYSDVTYNYFLRFSTSTPEILSQMKSHINLCVLHEKNSFWYLFIDVYDPSFEAYIWGHHRHLGFYDVQKTLDVKNFRNHRIRLIFLKFVVIKIQKLNLAK